MEQPHYKTFQEIDKLGVTFAYITASNSPHSFHWHEELELLYPLNGELGIKIEGSKYSLSTKELIVIESFKTHNIYAYTDTAMYLCIHISKKYMQKYFSDIELYEIQCFPDNIADLLSEYQNLCFLLDELTTQYIEKAPAFFMEAEGIVLQILARLIRFFAVKITPQTAISDTLTIESIRSILSYVEEHFYEQITLQDASETLGLTKEYFCRFFKKHMGISFMQYLNDVRAAHVHWDLLHTDIPVAQLAEKNGFFNQKQFNKIFRERYWCTPSSVRKNNMSWEKRA